MEVGGVNIVDGLYRLLDYGVAGENHIALLAKAADKIDMSNTTTGAFCIKY